MFNKLLDELHEMINALRKGYQSAVPVTEDDLKALHDKVSDVKEAAPTPAQLPSVLPIGDAAEKGAAEQSGESASASSSLAPDTSASATHDTDSADTSASTNAAS